MERLTINRLQSIEELKNFRCGVPKMDAFIHNGGLKESIRNSYCQAYSVRNAENKLVAFFALSFDSLQLDIDDVEDLQNGYAQILGKGRKMRTIFIPKKTAAEAFLFFKEMYHSDTGYIFKGQKAENISTRGIAEQIQRIGKRYGIRKEVCHPHAFRHYFAKRFLKSSRNNIVMLADLLGHASVDTTAIYLRMSQAETQKKFNNLVDW